MAAAAAAHDDDPYGDILTAILDGYGSLPPGSAVAMSPQWPDLFFSPVDAAFHLSAVGDRRPSGEDGDESDEQGRKDSKISVLVSLEVRGTLLRCEARSRRATRPAPLYPC